jgi:LemA protein
MSTPLAVTLALAAVVFFWMLGAHNRLVALRNHIIAAWGRVQDTLAQRSAALQPLVAALREPLAAEQGALDALLAAHNEAQQAAAALNAAPMLAAPALAWVAAESALAAAASRVTALLEQDLELRSHDTVAAPAAALRDTQSRLSFARQAFNEAAAEYNAALALFPTRLLMPVFRFAPAGRL